MSRQKKKLFVTIKDISFHKSYNHEKLFFPPALDISNYRVSDRLFSHFDVYLQFCSQLYFRKNISQKIRSELTLKKKINYLLKLSSALRLIARYL